MAVANPVHPTAETLRAFALGKLDEFTAAPIMAHLDACPDCTRVAAETPHDSFVNCFRATRPSQTTIPPTDSQIGPPATPAGASRAAIKVPAELKNIDQFDIVRELGHGGMGVVYLAKHKLTGRLEVLKVISKTMIHRQDAADRFLREIQMAVQLNHDNVVRAYGALQLDDMLVLIMEYVDGPDLCKVVEAEGPLPILKACYYARQAALGLQHAHERKMVHRDIKPSNLILLREGKKHTVKILDFGLAKATSEKNIGGLTSYGKMMGTPEYMAPEQMRDAATADIRADIYSLGCTLYYFLTGSPPFKVSSIFELVEAHRTGVIKPLNEVRKDVPVELAEVVAKMMVKERADRFQAPADVAAALLPFVKPAVKTQPAGKVAVEPIAPPTAIPVGIMLDEPTNAQVRPPRSDRPLALPPRVVQPVPVASAPSPPSRHRKSSRRQWLLGGAAVLVVGLVAAYFLATIIFRVETSAGTVLLEIDQKDAEVFVDGDKITIGRPGDKNTITVQAKEGKHLLRVTKPGFEAFTDNITFHANEPYRLKISLKPVNVALNSPSGKKQNPKEDAVPNKEKDPPKKDSAAKKGKEPVPQIAAAQDPPLGMKFVKVPNGTFWMGWGSDTKQCKQVTIAADFELAAHTVTQGQWQEVMGNNPSYFSRQGGGKQAVQDISDEDLKHFPVEMVAWQDPKGNDVQEFLQKFNEREKGRGWFYRLPSEAEWEYACRGAATSKEECSFDFYLDKPSNDLSWNQANFWSDNPAGNGVKGPKLGRTTKVGSYAPNKLGLYDMHGNVWQWCSDLYDEAGSDRVVRGGSWGSLGQFCRAAYRYGSAPTSRSSYLGFRLARVPSSS